MDCFSCGLIGYLPSDKIYFSPLEKSSLLPRFSILTECLTILLGIPTRKSLVILDSYLCLSLHSVCPKAFPSRYLWDLYILQLLYHQLSPCSWLVCTAPLSPSVPCPSHPLPGSSFWVCHPLCHLSALAEMQNPIMLFLCFQPLNGSPSPTKSNLPSVYFLSNSSISYSKHVQQVTTRLFFCPDLRVHPRYLKFAS